MVINPIIFIINEYENYFGSPHKFVFMLQFFSRTISSNSDF